MRDSMLTFRPRQRGISILVAIFLVVILAGLGIFIVSVTGLQRSAETLDLQGVRAYQAARTGVEWAAFQVLDPNNALNPPSGSCATMGVPTCPTSPTHLTGLAGSLSTFTVSVECTPTATKEGNRDIYVFEVTATACNQPLISGSCIGAGPGDGYVERQIKATLSKCKDATATGPRCSCG
jgi:MSHA biogenesis protein MshP